MKYEPLSRQEVSDVIRGVKNAPRVPVILHFWTHAGAFGENEKRVSDMINEYPQDIQTVPVAIPDVFNAPEDDKEYRWVNYDSPNYEGVGLDERVAIDDWSKLDGIIEAFPNPDYEGVFRYASKEKDGRYRLACWWFCLFERHWQLRGMTNALTDYYDYPEEVHKLFRAVTDFYLRIIERSKYEMDADGVFTSDDLGTQESQFFSQEIFDEFYKPYYKEIVDKAHSLNMDFWLHTCGCIDKFLPSFIEIGIDVIHPIQKYTMEEKKIADEFGDKICIWAGFDVQRVIPYGTSEDVRNEVRFMYDTYGRSDGRFMFTAGNGINGDCPVESLEALYDEAYKYKWNGY